MIETKTIQSAEGNSSSQDAISSLYAMAYGLYRNGKYLDARDFFRYLTITDTHDRRHWMGLGACYHMMKEYRKAIECYSVAAIQNPDDPHTHFYAAECSFHLGEVDLAIKTLESAQATAAKSPEHAPLLTQFETLHQAWSRKAKGAAHG